MGSNNIPHIFAINIIPMGLFKQFKTEIKDNQGDYFLIKVHKFIYYLFLISYFFLAILLILLVTFR
jgi:hypothetical protein